MRIPRIASSILLVSLLVSAPALAQQPAGIEPSDAAAQPKKGAAEDPAADDESDDTPDDDDSEATPRELAAEGAESDAPPRELVSEDDDDDNEPDEKDVEVVVEKEVVTRTEVRSVDNSRIESAWNSRLDEMSQRYQWRLFIGGFIRAQYTGIQNDVGNGIVGQNDGFLLGNARLTLEGTMRDSLGFRLQFDGAIDRNRSANTASGEVVTRLRDALVYWAPFSFLRVDFGQFKPPFDVEEVFSTADLLFVDRSVGSRGVQGIEGFNQPGLSVPREVGIKLGSDGFFPFAGGDEPEGFGVSYGLALTNGESANRTRNDNDSLAYYGRLGLHWGDYVRVGGGYYINNALVGEQPDVIREDRNGLTADLTLRAFGATAIASYLQKTSANPEVAGEPEETGSAYQVSLAYKEPFLGFEPAIRYAYYDPTDALDNDALTYITAGLNYRPDYPVTLMVNYTVTGEEEGRELNNNRFDAMLQVEW